MGEIKNKFDQAKSWWTSSTIVATILLVVSTALGFFGIDLGNLIPDLWDAGSQLADGADSIWVVIQNAILAFTAIRGRTKASTTIK